jgi:hypothetical protein
MYWKGFRITGLWPIPENILEFSWGSEETRKHLRKAAGLPTQIRIGDLPKLLDIYGYMSLLVTDIAT